MAIRVTTNRHHIYPPTQLTERLISLTMAGAMAKVLEQDKLYNDLKNAFNSLKNQWESSTAEICKQKTKTNWLGGGDVYTYSPCDNFEDTTMDVYVETFNSYNKQELIDMLNNTIRKLNSKY